jgi:site-specific DNA-cytosine methylase
MLRDAEFATEDRIKISLRIFSEHDIPTKTFPIEPVSVTAETFHRRLPTISTDTSRYIAYRLQQSQWLNSYNYLLHNPRRNLAWQGFLGRFDNNNNAKNKEILANMNQHKGVIVELMNTIYGEHEISYERSFEALRWLRQLRPSRRRNRTKALL